MHSWLDDQWQPAIEKALAKYEIWPFFPGSTRPVDRCQEVRHLLLRVAATTGWLLVSLQGTPTRSQRGDQSPESLLTCDHDNIEVRINLLGRFIHLITASVRQLQVQKHEIGFLL